MEEEDEALLPHDLLYFFINNHLNARDTLALALSGAISDRVAPFHGTNRRCSISCCYFLTVSRWGSFFRQHIDPLALTSFEANHCYWLPPQVLVDSVVQMINLEELEVLDTQVTLMHLLKAFVSCTNISKLAVSLHRLPTLVGFQFHPDQAAVSCMKACFNRLTQLKLFNFEAYKVNRVGDPDHFVTAWPITLEVLSWCSRNCVDLKLEISCGDIDPMSYDDMDEVVEIDASDHARDVQYPLLAWMSSLRSLIITRRSCHALAKDEYVRELLVWMFKNPTDSLERLWVDDSSDLFFEFNFGGHLTASSVTSFCVGEDNTLVSSGDVNHQRYLHMENLGSFKFRRLVKQLPNLKYARGRCIRPEDVIGLFQFCESHPMLESLHFDTEWIQEKPIFVNKPEWKLLHLKDLVYHCEYPEKVMIDHVVEACPNLEHLHIGMKINGSIEDVTFLSAIRFRNLRSLSFSGFNLLDGSFLPSCLNLESLHLKGTLVPAAFLSKIGECLPLATKLRDLRLEWDNEEKLSDVLLFLKELVKCSAHLERIVLCYHKPGTLHLPVEWVAPPDFEDLLVSFASQMGHLVALCLSGFRIDPNVILGVEQRIAQEICRERPSFWFYLARDLPKGNDPKIPRVHYDGIVDPIDWYYAPPPSF